MSNGSEEGQFQIFAQNYFYASSNFSFNLFDQLNDQHVSMQFQEEEQQNKITHATFNNIIQTNKNAINIDNIPSDKKLSSPQKSKDLQINEFKQKQLMKIKKGNPKETTQLNENFKTLTKRFLIESLKLKIFPHNVTKIINAFILSGTSLQQNFKLLNENIQIRNKCLQYFLSPLFIKQILGSPYMQLKNKIIFLKYLTTIQKNFKGQQFKNWKKLKKHSQIKK